MMCHMRTKLFSKVLIRGWLYPTARGCVLFRVGKYLGQTKLYSDYNLSGAPLSENECKTKEYGSPGKCYIAMLSKLHLD